MKNIDELLAQVNVPEPRRELSSDFVAQVVTELRAHPSAPRKESLLMQMFHKPLIATLAVVLSVLIIGGSAYAATDGFKFLNVFFGAITSQTDGSTILRLDTKSCDVAHLTTGTSADTTSSVYYRIAKDSKLSYQEVATVLQGQCEISAIEDASTVMATRVADQYHSNDNTSTDVSLVDGVVKSLSSDSITVTTNYSIAANQSGKTNTFIVDPAAVKIDSYGGTSLTYAELKKGDHISLISYITGSIDSNQPKLAGYIQRHSDTIAKSVKINAKEGVDFTRVSPCANDSKKYCAVGGNDPLFTAENLKTTDVASLMATVQSVYDKYVAEATTPYAADHFYGFTTPELTKTLKAGGYDYDPITCYQQIPTSVKIERNAAASNPLSFQGSVYQDATKYSSFTVTLDATTHDIANIACNS